MRVAFTLARRAPAATLKSASEYNAGPARRVLNRWGIIVKPKNATTPTRRPNSLAACPISRSRDVLPIWSSSISTHEKSHSLLLAIGYVSQLARSRGAKGVCHAGMRARSLTRGKDTYRVSIVLGVALWIAAYGVELISMDEHGCTRHQA